MEEEAEVVRLVYQRAYEGNSNRKIAYELNIMDYPTPTGVRPWFSAAISRVLRNPTYAGYVPYGGALYDGKHTPIIDRSFWEEIQRRIDKRRKFGGRGVGSDSLLVGLLRCGYCERPMGARRTGKESIYYGCTTRRDTGGAVCRPNNHAEAEIVGQVF